MFKKYGVFLSVLLIMVMLFTGCNQNGQNTVDKIKSEAEQQTLVYFFSKHCSVCQEEKSIWEELEEKEKENFNFISVDVDDFRNKDIIDLFSIETLPTFVLLNKDGSVYTVGEGFHSEVQLINLLEEATKATTSKGE